MSLPLLTTLRAGPRRVGPVALTRRVSLRVSVAIVLQSVPLDVRIEELSSNRNAIYSRCSSPGASCACD